MTSKADGADSDSSDTSSDCIILDDSVGVQLENRHMDLNMQKNTYNCIRNNQFRVQKIMLGMRVLALRDKFKHIWKLATIHRIIEGKQFFHSFI